MTRFAMVLLLLGCGAAPTNGPLEPAPPSDPQAESALAPRELGAQGKTAPAARPAASASSAGVGTQAPGGVFTRDDGSKLDLGAAVQGRGAIVVFYQGHWCRQCRKQLAELQAVRSALLERGFEIYAVSTDEPAMSAELRVKLGLQFPLLSDTAGLHISGWGVFTKMHELARPAVFVVAPGGRISYRYVSDTPADRPSPETVVMEAQKAVAPE